MTLPFADASVVLLLLALVIIAVTALAVVGRWTPAVGEEPVIDLRGSLEPITAQMLREVRFTVTLRGYRMAEVDALLARLQEQMEHQPDAPVARERVIVDSPHQ